MIIRKVILILSFVFVSCAVFASGPVLSEEQAD